MVMFVIKPTKYVQERVQLLEREQERNDFCVEEFCEALHFIFKYRAVVGEMSLAHTFWKPKNR